MLNKLTRGIVMISLICLPQVSLNSFAIERDIKDVQLKNDISVTIFNNSNKSFGLHEGYNNIIDDIQNHNKIQKDVNLRIDNIIERKEKEEEKRIKEENSFNITFILTHYGRNLQENGGYTTTCTGKPLKEGIVASNYWSLGTIIELEDGRRYIVGDTGGDSFNSPERLDVFVDTYDYNHLNKLGKYEIKGRVIKE